MNLTPKQRALAIKAYRFPEKVTGATILTARQLENRGLGSVERWNDGDVLFRLNQAGCDLVATFHSLADNEKVQQDHA